MYYIITTCSINLSLLISIGCCIIHIRRVIIFSFATQISDIVLWLQILQIVLFGLDVNGLLRWLEHLRLHLLNCGVVTILHMLNQFIAVFLRLLQRLGHQMKLSFFLHLYVNYRVIFLFQTREFLLESLILLHQGLLLRIQIQGFVPKPCYLGL